MDELKKLTDDYTVYFIDGCSIDAKNAIISSRGEAPRTTFMYENGNTLAVFPDCAVKYIARTDSYVKP